LDFEIKFLGRIWSWNTKPSISVAGWPAKILFLLPNERNRRKIQDIRWNYSRQGSP